MPSSSLSTLAVWPQEIQALLPKLSRPQARVIGEMVYAILMVDGCGMTRICSFLSHLLGKTPETLRQKYREILYEKEAKAGVKKRGCKRRDITVEEHFADLLRGVLKGWEGQRTLALALDASTLTDRFDVLSISVLTRGGAIRVAWTMLEGHQEGAWRSHWERMLRLLRDAVPVDWKVVVMADRGLYAAWLFEAIQANGWHPLLRVNSSMTFCQTGSDAFVPIETLVREPGGGWKGSGAWSETGKRVQGTLAIRREQGYEEAIAVVTDLEPDQVQASWYQMRFWIETEYKDGKRGWFHWEQSKMTDPQRAGRLWLLLSIALQKAILLGNALEAREEAERERRRKNKAAHVPAAGELPGKRPRGREQSLLMRGMMALRAAACGSGEVLPQGRICFEPLPEQLYPRSKPSKSDQQKKQQKEERKRNRQRRREREREARQEIRQQRQQAKQAEAEARRAARMERRREREQQTEARKQRQQEKQALREARSMAPMASLLTQKTTPASKPKGQADDDLTSPAGNRRASRFPKEEPLLRLVRGRLQSPPGLRSERVPVLAWEPAQEAGSQKTYP